jgi:hypothetical protein
MARTVSTPQAEREESLTAVARECDESERLRTQSELLEQFGGIADLSVNQRQGDC